MQVKILLLFTIVACDASEIVAKKGMELATDANEKKSTLNDEFTSCQVDNSVQHCTDEVASVDGRCLMSLRLRAKPDDPKEMKAKPTSEQESPKPPKAEANGADLGPHRIRAKPDDPKEMKAKPTSEQESPKPPKAEANGADLGPHRIRAKPDDPKEGAKPVAKQ